MLLEIKELVNDVIFVLLNLTKGTENKVREREREFCTVINKQVPSYCVYCTVDKCVGVNCTVNVGVKSDFAFLFTEKGLKIEF